MMDALGIALRGFSAALDELRRELAGVPALRDALFADAVEWRALLDYKLLPSLAGEGCLVVAVAGGTNTGKSTVFNLLAGAALSPVRNTAAATCRPLLAGNARRVAECLAGTLIPEFDARALEDPESVVRMEGPENVLYAAVRDSMPDAFVLLDTPDVDSIETRHWASADAIRAAGDVVIATITPEKYKDDRVVAFFRRAHASGRLVLPVMNKANPEDRFASARRQLNDFCEDVGLKNAATFAVPRDITLDPAKATPIARVDGGAPLHEHLAGLDVQAIKRQVYRDTLHRFCTEAAVFLSQLSENTGALRHAADSCAAQRLQHARRYDPAPGPEVAGLFHAYVQSKRGNVARTIGDVSSGFVRGATKVTRVVRQAVARRASLEAPITATETALQQKHREQIGMITRDYTNALMAWANALPPRVAALVQPALKLLDTDAAVDAVARDTLRAENISEEFREHARRMLDTWWNDHRGRRHVLLALDTTFAIMPAAIAVPVSLYVGGIGLPETMIVAGPLMEQFLARVVEYQFGDAMFDFLSPWREEQRQHLSDALEKHVAAPVLTGLRDALACLDGETCADLRERLEACRKALPK
jgi:hypothetical protein